MSYRFISSLAIPWFCLIFAACGSTKTTVPGQGAATSDTTRYVITYIIHGDANYLYHDTSGVARQADQKVLAEAKQVAQNATQGEVFIFHQRPETKVLGIFPKKDRDFFHYKKGILVRHQSYSPANDTAFLASETELFGKYRSVTTNKTKKILLYFGHEIPLKDGHGYFKSIPELNLNTQTFTAGLKRMLPESIPNRFFDLAVLSTCNNGSPDMVAAMIPVTRVLLASPQNLHLSHIDSRALASLDADPEMKSSELASMLAENTYERLKKSIQTVISLSVYNIGEMEPHIQRADSAYRAYLSAKSKTSNEIKNTDCTLLPIFSEIGLNSVDVETWYRPPQFGRDASIKTHSGWGCKSGQ